MRFYHAQGSELGRGGWKRPGDEVPSPGPPTPASLPVVCLNGGVANLTECLCPPGYSGPTCQEVDAATRCSDGSTVVGHRCVCPPGRSGPRCDTRDEATACRNGGTAVGTECYCPGGFSGPRCEYRPTTAISTSGRTTAPRETPGRPTRSRATLRSTMRTTITHVPTTTGWLVFLGGDAQAKTHHQGHV